MKMQKARPFQAAMDALQQIIPQIMLEHYQTKPEDKIKYCVLFSSNVMASFETAEEAMAMQQEALDNHVHLYVVSPALKIS